jgi:hypothetical protein
VRAGRGRREEGGGKGEEGRGEEGWIEEGKINSGFCFDSPMRKMPVLKKVRGGKRGGEEVGEEGRGKRKGTSRIRSTLL